MWRTPRGTVQTKSIMRMIPVVSEQALNKEQQRQGNTNQPSFRREEQEQEEECDSYCSERENSFKNQFRELIRSEPH